MDIINETSLEIADDRKRIKEKWLFFMCDYDVLRYSSVSTNIEYQLQSPNSFRL